MIYLFLPYVYYLLKSKSTFLREESLHGVRLLTSVILATQEAKIRRVRAQGQGQHRQNVSETSTSSWVWWHMTVISAT
jgi:hypothetical protein